MEIRTDNRQNRYEISLDRIHKKATVILNALNSPDGELSVLIVDDAQIASLNKKFLDREGPTNVIAFPMGEGLFSHVNPQLLGDVVISIETASREAESAGIDLEKRMTQLLVHGILHLFGYDHEKNKQDALRMNAKSKALLKSTEHL